MTDLLLLPGDGIGPEVTAQARRVAAGHRRPDLSHRRGARSAAISFDQLGTPLVR